MFGLAQRSAYETVHNDFQKTTLFSKQINPKLLCFNLQSQVVRKNWRVVGATPPLSRGARMATLGYTEAAPDKPCGLKTWSTPVTCEPEVEYK